MSFPKLKLLLHTFKLNQNPKHLKVYVTNFHEEMKIHCVSDYLKKTNRSLILTLYIKDLPTCGEESFCYPLTTAFEWS